MTEYRPRRIDTLVDELLTNLPAVMITGPRASGKTTTAVRHATSVVHLDRPAESAVFRADPDVALKEYREPILLDEWQEVPALLGAVKRAIDEDSRPGRFILTGSVRADLDTATWPGTGRVVRISMYGMTVLEQLGRLQTKPFIDRLAEGARLTLPANVPNLRDYIELALRSGFPEPALLLSSSRARTQWLDGYVEQIINRDAIGIEPRRDPKRLRRYFESYALNSAGIVNDVKLLQAAGINRKTAVAYERLLNSLFIVESLPAWTSNRLRRLSLRAKRYVVDPALVASGLGLDSGSFLRDGDLLGRLLETFVVAQLRGELAVCEKRPRLYHLREEHGRYEIDILAELAGQDLIAFEVKADAAPDQDAARHLAWLRDRLGKRFLRGIVFHTGPSVFDLSERITAVPICALWA